MMVLTLLSSLAFGWTALPRMMHAWQHGEEWFDAREGGYVIDAAMSGTAGNVSAIYGSGRPNLRHVPICLRCTFW